MWFWDKKIILSSAICYLFGGKMAESMLEEESTPYFHVDRSSLTEIMLPFDLTDALLLLFHKFMIWLKLCTQLNRIIHLTACLKITINHNKLTVQLKSYPIISMKMNSKFSKVMTAKIHEISTHAMIYDPLFDDDFINMQKNDVQHLKQKQIYEQTTKQTN